MKDYCKSGQIHAKKQSDFCSDKYLTLEYASLYKYIVVLTLSL